ncbi:hypothetical protein M408DRAFT_31089 [Serendipita vermifera MAFF 305830]|uniref:F-box domain-containing protein n=1 Tax=Serendipita vermifera MAFF 305830 TaxID=933852 RepID=A0A0C3A4L3_SERVB|nr:hypothetical protein M408DRAFT_31089 [Serendipita vermifera MAFF 305830]
MPWVPAGEKERVNGPYTPMQFPWVDLSSIIAISHVNRCWREAALATPACWGTITIRFADFSKEKALREKAKIDFLLSRAQNFLLDVIILDEGAQDIWLPRWEFLATMKSSFKRARSIYARMVGIRLANHVIGELRDVETLEFLALWWYDHGTLRIEDQENGSSRGCMPMAYLRHAPKLRSVQTYGFPYPDPQIDPISLPSLESLILEDDPAHSQSLRGYDHLLRSCKLAISLTLVPSYSLLNTHSGPIITLPHLKYLELSPVSIIGVFRPSPRLIAPVLDTVAFRLKGGNSSLYQSEIVIISRELENSAALRKRFVLTEFGDDSRALRTRVHYAWPWSLVGCLRVLKYFEFVDTLEFRSCIWGFKPIWNRIWIHGADPNWATMGDGEIRLNKRSYVDEGDLDTRSPLSDANPITIDNSDLEGTNVSGSIHHQTPNLGRGESGSLLYSHKEVFMPNLRTITFKNCNFTDANGTSDFAHALARRQEILTRIGTSAGLERVCFIGKLNESSKAFCSQLRQAKGLEEVDIQVTEK